MTTVFGILVQRHRKHCVLIFSLAGNELLTENNRGAQCLVVISWVGRIVEEILNWMNVPKRRLPLPCAVGVGETKMIQLITF